jgi:hypothetical protein
VLHGEVDGRTQTSQLRGYSVKTFFGIEGTCCSTQSRRDYLIEEQGGYLAEDNTYTTMSPLQSAAYTYRATFCPGASQKVLSLQSMFRVNMQHTQKRRVSEQGFSLHAEVRCTMNQRNKLEQLCRYISPHPRAMGYFQRKTQTHRYWRSCAATQDLKADTHPCCCVDRFWPIADLGSVSTKLSLGAKLYVSK